MKYKKFLFVSCQTLLISTVTAGCIRNKASVKGLSNSNKSGLTDRFYLAQIKNTQAPVPIPGATDVLEGQEVLVGIGCVGEDFDWQAVDPKNVIGADGKPRKLHERRYFNPGSGPVAVGDKVALKDSLEKESLSDFPIYKEATKNTKASGCKILLGDGKEVANYAKAFGTTYKSDPDKVLVQALNSVSKIMSAVTCAGTLACASQKEVGYYNDGAQCISAIFKERNQKIQAMKNDPASFQEMKRQAEAQRMQTAKALIKEGRDAKGLGKAVVSLKQIKNKKLVEVALKSLAPVGRIALRASQNGSIDYGSAASSAQNLVVSDDPVGAALMGAAGMMPCSALTTQMIAGTSESNEKSNRRVFLKSLSNAYQHAQLSLIKTDPEFKEFLSGADGTAIENISAEQAKIFLARLNNEMVPYFNQHDQGKFTQGQTGPVQVSPQEFFKLVAELNAALPNEGAFDTYSSSNPATPEKTPGDNVIAPSMIPKVDPPQDTQ